MHVCLCPCASVYCSLAQLVSLVVAGALKPGKGKSDKWHQEYSLCTPCAKLYNKGQYCPMCHKTWDDDAAPQARMKSVQFGKTCHGLIVCLLSVKQAMIGCDKCNQWTHIQCDGISDEAFQRLGLSGAKYFCITCREGKGSKTKEIAEFKNTLHTLTRSRKAKRPQPTETNRVAGTQVK